MDDDGYPVFRPGLAPGQQGSSDKNPDTFQPFKQYNTKGSKDVDQGISEMNKDVEEMNKFIKKKKNQ